MHPDNGMALPGHGMAMGQSDIWGAALGMCLTNVFLLWAVPLLASVVPHNSLNPDTHLAVVAVLGGILEVILWVSRRSKELRLFLRHIRFLTPSVRILFAVALQVLIFTTCSLSADDVLLLGKASGLSLPADWVGKDFVVDADPATLVWNPKTISVILPCAEEREYALKTVKAVFDSTPPEVLHEIIVVDDGSSPPLTQTYLDEDVQRQYKTKVLRHTRTVGLIQAKKTGGDAATGDIIVFFDCHVAPQPEWHRSFLKLIGQNYRRMVVPQITDLDIDTWTQNDKAGGGRAKCYLTWDADFKWFDSDDVYIAVISGGLLGMSRRWWFETGGYDEQMLGWGGENLDQSLRVWLCGGEIVAAEDSAVAHMWRLGTFATRARYWTVGDTAANRARAVYGWYGEFAEKLSHFPNFNMRNWGRSFGFGPWYGNVSNIWAVRDRLKCRPFAWFLQRFKSLYEDAGLIPRQVFKLREEGIGKCLRFDGSAGTSKDGLGTASLASCDGDEDHRLFWHVGNRNARTGRCCSGLRAWNTEQCLQDLGGGLFKTFVCETAGISFLQEWAVSSSTGRLASSYNDRCAEVEDGGLQEVACQQAGGSRSRWSKVSAIVPLERKLYEKAHQEHPEVFANMDKQLFAAGEAFPSRSRAICDTALGGCIELYPQAGGFERCLSIPPSHQAGAFVQDLTECTSFYVFGGALRPAHAQDFCLGRSRNASTETWGIFICDGGPSQKFHRYEGAFCNAADECLAFK